MRNWSEHGQVVSTEHSQCVSTMAVFSQKQVKVNNMQMLDTNIILARAMALQCSQRNYDTHNLMANELSLTGLDIGYVPAGSHALLRLSGQFGPPQFTFHWPEGPVFLVLRMPPLFLLGIGKTRKATLICTYFSYRPNVQKCATLRVKS